MSENGSPDEPTRASSVAVVGVLAAVGLMLLLVTWAATIGPQEVVTDDGSPPSYPTLSPSASATEAPTGVDASARGSGGGNDVLPEIVTIVASGLAGVLMAALLLTAVRWLLTRDWRRRRREPDPAEVEFDPLDAPALLAEKMLAGELRQREALATGSPRNAIVACWHSFEELAEGAGVRRQRWETSSEFTMRVLDMLSADGGAVLRLAELYRDARHSEHDITETNRRSATEALDAIHRSLGARASDRGAPAGSP